MSNEVLSERRQPWMMGDDGGIAGWFDFGPLYDRMIETAPPGSILVEVGVFCGRSLIYLATEAKKANKGLRVVGVDTFRGSPEHKDDMAAMPNGALIREAWNNLDNAGVLDDVTLIVGDSREVAYMVEWRNLWAVFLDAAHDERSVLSDIDAWEQMIEIGGWIAGHDYHSFPGVKAAVDKFFPGIQVPENETWWAWRKGGGQ